MAKKALKKPAHYVPQPQPQRSRPDPPLEMPKYLADLPKQAALVYQGSGYAYVYQVETMSRLSKARGRTHLILKASFQECWRFTQGLAHAGWQADTFSCTELGQDMSRLNWTRKYEENPWWLLFKDRIVNVVK